MGESVLIVDDERDVRLLLREILLLGDSGREISEARDGVDALEKLRAGSYGVVLCDIAMPRMDGLALLGVLHKERADLPVVVITAAADVGTIVRCLSEGAWDYIVKPFEVEQVLAAVRRALRAGRHLRSRPGDIEVVWGGRGWLELTTGTEIEYLLRFRRFTEVLLGTDLPPDEREDLRLAIEELGRNAIEWGNRHERAKRVRLAVALFDDRVVLKIEDEGGGFLPDALPDPSADPVAHVERRLREGKRFGGYGIAMVKKAMDEVIFSEKGSVVVATKRFR